MKNNILLIIFFLSATQIFGQNESVTNDSIKRLIFIEALDNFSTSPNFIVFTAVTSISNESREICQLGGYFIHKTVENNNAKIIDWDKQIIQFSSFVITDTTHYQEYDSTLKTVTDKMYIKDIELLPFDFTKYKYLDSKYGDILIDNANMIIDINKKLFDIGFDENKKDLRENLIMSKREYYKVIRELYFEYKYLVPHYYFNHGILTSTGCYAGEFQIDKNFNK